MTSSATPATEHAYRSPTVLLAPGVLFRAGQGVTIATLLIVAIAAIAQLWARVSFDVCVSEHGVYFCAMKTPALTLSDIGVPLSWQAAWIDMPLAFPAIALLCDVAAAFYFIRPRTVRLDPGARTIALHHRRWPRRTSVQRVRLDDIILVCVKEMFFFFHAVALIDRDGRPYDVTGLRLGRRRQERLAAAIEAAIERAV